MEESLNETTISNEMSSSDVDKLREIYSEEVLQYYSDYDPMVGIRITITLAVLITLFGFFLFYKTKSNIRAKRLLEERLRTQRHYLASNEATRASGASASASGS